jgi:hypothetical protein
MDMRLVSRAPIPEGAQYYDENDVNQQLRIDLNSARVQIDALTTSHDRLRFLFDTERTARLRLTAYAKAEKDRADTEHGRATIMAGLLLRVADIANQFEVSEPERETIKHAAIVAGEQPAPAPPMPEIQVFDGDTGA